MRSTRKQNNMKERFFKMIEKKEIHRLEKIVDRLNSVLEKKLLTEYRAKKPRMSKDQLLDFLCSLESTVSNFAAARNAKQMLEYANAHYGTIVAQDKYILCAMLVSEVLQSLSLIDTTRVLCGIRIETQLKERLKAFGKPATQLLLFMDSPVGSWSHSDYYNHRGIREFKLVKSRADIRGLLVSGFRDITAYELSGIRIFYKRDAISVYTHSQQEEIMKQLQTNLSEEVKKEFLCSGGLEILYPDSEFHGIYYIYVPENL